MPSRLASKPQYSSANVVNIQLPPLALVTAMTLPFKSAGVLIFGDAMMLPMSLLMMPATNTRSIPSAAEPSTAPVAEPGMQLGFARGQRRHADRPIADGDKRQLQTIATKKTLVLSHVHCRFALAERAAGHDDFRDGWAAKTGGRRT